MKNSFVFYTEWIEQIRLLEENGTQEDLEAFWGAVRAFVEEGEGEADTAMAKISFVPIRNQIARDTAKYEEISEKRRNARLKDKDEQTITNDNKPEQKLTNGTEDDDVDEDVDDDVSPKGDVCIVGAEPIIGLPLNDGSEHPVTSEDIAEYSRLYPAVDIMQELRDMRGWLLANPTRRKTKRGVKAFIRTWLSKEQDKPVARSGTTSRKLTAEDLINLPTINPWSEAVT